MDTTTAKKNFILGYHNRLCAEGLKSLIEQNHQFEVVDLIENGHKLIQAVRSNSIDFLIVDLIYPGCNSVEYIREIRHTSSKPKMLLISDLIQNGLLTDIVNTGIEGYILHTCNRRDLETAIFKLLDGERYICTTIISQMLSKNSQKVGQDPKFSLTSREREILGMLIKTKTNKYIATELNISELTVKTHRKNIMRKFGSRNLLSLVRYACRENLINGENDDFCKGCPHRFRLNFN